MPPTRATYINSTYDGGNMAQFSHAPQLHPCMSGYLSTLLLNYKFYRVGQVISLEPTFISLAVLRQSVSSLRIHLLLQLPAYPGLTDHPVIMQDSARMISVIHTRSWMDQDLKWNHTTPNRERMGGKSSPAMCSCSSLFPLADSCILHHTILPNTSDSISPAYSQHSHENVLLGGMKITSKKIEEIWVKCSDTQIDYKRKSPPLT
jgi:hypothetical protein